MLKFGELPRQIKKLHRDIENVKCDANYAFNISPIAVMNAKLEKILYVEDIGSNVIELTG